MCMKGAFAASIFFWKMSRKFHPLEMLCVWLMRAPITSEGLVKGMIFLQYATENFRKAYGINLKKQFMDSNNTPETGEKIDRRLKKIREKMIH